MEVPDISEDSSSLKKRSNTVIVKSRSSDELLGQSSYPKKEEYEDLIFNVKRKYGKTIVRYFKGVLAQGGFKRKQEELASRRKSSKSLRTDFKQVVKSQEGKMAELREELLNLKRTNNLDQSLNLLIRKVNDNISSLKSYDNWHLARRS